jgi:hypothetical protein
MWMAGFTPVGKGYVRSCYNEGELPSSKRLELHVCAYASGHFVFQVVAERGLSFIVLFHQPGFE